MTTVEIHARVFGADGRAAGGRNLQIEAFDIASEGWVTVGEGQTGRGGALVVRDLRLPGRAKPVNAPALRLIESGEPAPRVVVDGGMVSVNTVEGTPILHVDFGDVELLDDTAYPRAAAHARRTKLTHTVAGRPRRGGVGEAVLVRALSRLAPDLIGTVIDRESVLEGSFDAWARLGVEVSSQLDDANIRAEIVSGLQDASASQLNAHIVDLQGRLGRTEAKLLEARTKIVDLEANLLTAQTNWKDTLEELTVFTEAAGQAVPIKDLASELTKQAGQANKASLDADAGFRVAKVHVELHGVFGNDAKSITLANAVELKKQGAGQPWQNLSLDLIPERQPHPTTSNIEVPGVTGLTESAAHRTLAATGLRMSAVSKPGGARDGYAVGQAVLQAPEAGTSVQEGETVIVVFAAP